MGLKYGVVQLDLSNGEIKIRPLWDWNLIIVSIISPIPKIKIRPLWDWNIPKQNLRNLNGNIKIRPLWDWNPHKLQYSISHK